MDFIIFVIEIMFQSFCLGIKRVLCGWQPLKIIVVFRGCHFFSRNTGINEGIHESENGDVTPFEFRQK